MIKDKIKVLVVEDSTNDAHLIEYHIRRIVDDPEIKMVDTFIAFVGLVHDFNPDIVISDFKMNGFTGMEILKYVNKNTTISNFIFLTGTIHDEELAAETILSGATGYILKKHMKVLHTKLLPYFINAVNGKKSVDLPEGSNEMFAAMRNFIDDSKRNNAAILQSYNEIKKTLEKHEYLKNK